MAKPHSLPAASPTGADSSRRLRNALSVPMGYHPVACTTGAPSSPRSSSRARYRFPYRRTAKMSATDQRRSRTSPAPRRSIASCSAAVASASSRWCGDTSRPPGRPPGSPCSAPSARPRSAGATRTRRRRSCGATPRATPGARVRGAVGAFSSRSIRSSRRPSRATRPPIRAAPIASRSTSCAPGASTAHLDRPAQSHSEPDVSEASSVPVASAAMGCAATARAPALARAAGSSLHPAAAPRYRSAPTPTTSVSAPAPTARGAAGRGPARSRTPARPVACAGPATVSAGVWRRPATTTAAGPRSTATASTPAAATITTSAPSVVDPSGCASHPTTYRPARATRAYAAKTPRHKRWPPSRRSSKAAESGARSSTGD